VPPFSFFDPPPPPPAPAALEDELTALGNYIGIGAMGFAGTSMVVATHVELAHTHTGGLPVGIHQFCLSSRRATARLFPDGRAEFRGDPGWFTDYYRRQGVE
jgi:L(+)-tartrate dehydratase alpha subunit